MNVTDAGRNCADAVNLALVLGGIDRWVAPRMSDGKTDGAIYDTKADAIRHQLHEYQCAYIQIPPGGMTPEHATRFLMVMRKFYDAGMRIADPVASPIMPNTIEEFNNIFVKGRR